MEFRFPLYISLIPVAVPVAFLLLGLFLCVKVNKIPGLLIGPMLLMDRVIVDDSRIRQYTGFWFDQTEKGFSLDEIEYVTITTGRDLKGRVIEVWIAEYKDRPSETIDPGDLWESNGDAIAKYVSALGIDVVRSAN